MPGNNRTKRAQADDLAGALVDETDIEFDRFDIQSMTDPILFTYLETLGYEWTGESWVLIGELP